MPVVMPQGVICQSYNVVCGKCKKATHVLSKPGHNITKKEMQDNLKSNGWVNLPHTCWTCVDCQN